MQTTAQIPASELKSGMLLTDTRGNRRFVTRDATTGADGRVCFRWDLTRRPSRNEMLTWVRSDKLYTVNGAA